MFRLTKPSRTTILSFLEAQRTESYSYSEVGRSREAAPVMPGYNIAHNRVQLGTGRDTFDQAKRALLDWRMFEMPWVELCRLDGPIAVGINVAVLASHYGFCSLNPCRVVYTFDERDVDAERFGFAYGTLPGHGGIGEERFTVEFHARDGAVWYDLYAFSRPGPIASLGAPLMLALQRRFARDSLSAMVNATRRTS
jgi:uncharacterized protein (UPF0548 family)